MAISQKNNEALKNPWALGLLVFLIVFLVANAVFIYLAFKQAPNLVVQDFYQRGENYQQTQKEIEQQKALGWTATLLTPIQLTVDQQQKVELIIQGENATALHLDSVTFHAYRPSDGNADFMKSMTKTANGVYQAEVTFVLPGVWDVIVEAKKAEDKFLLTKRLTVSP